MSNHANLAAALLAAFNLDADKADPVAIADALATVMVSFADLVRGPAPIMVMGEDGIPSLLSPEPAGQAELIAEVRNLICEIRADRQQAVEDRKDSNRLFRSYMGGLPG